LLDLSRKGAKAKKILQKRAGQRFAPSAAQKYSNRATLLCRRIFSPQRRKEAQRKTPLKKRGSALRLFAGEIFSGYKRLCAKP
jgi:hypothetical protein